MYYDADNLLKKISLEIGGLMLPYKAIHWNTSEDQHLPSFFSVKEIPSYLEPLNLYEDLFYLIP